jgi:hypothetical protein
MKRVLTILILALGISAVTSWNIIQAFEGPKPLPTYPHIKQTYSNMCYTRFLTEDKPDTVFAYYRDAMAKDGWHYSTEHSEAIDNALYFERGKYFAIIAIIKHEHDLTTVQVTADSLEGPFTHCGDMSELPR